MKITRLQIENYKSLKSIDFAPADFSVLVGPNGSGKSNFVDALDFLAKIYSHDLELAVAMKGGYENIGQLSL